MDEINAEKYFRQRYVKCYKIFHRTFHMTSTKTCETALDKIDSITERVSDIIAMKINNKRL